MRAPSLLAVATTIVAVFTGSAIAAPADITSLDSRAATVPCDPLDKYTMAYFEANMCRRPAASTCLFYTSRMAHKARAYATSHQLTTIYSLWDPSWFDYSSVKTNPRRCIMQKPGDRLKYFRVMSATMASTCKVFATVMDPNPNNVRLDGVWGSDELPTLKKNNTAAMVYSIDAISPDGTKIKSPYWVREAKNKLPVDPRDVEDELPEYSNGLAERATCQVVSEATAAQFDEGGKYPVSW